MLTTVLFEVTLLPYATFFGIAIYMLIAPCYDKLSGQSFTEFFQAVDPYMKVWAPRLLLTQIAMTLLLLILLANQWFNLPFWLTFFALLMGITSMGIAVKGNVPINRQMDHWLPAAPPPDWKEVRDRWLHYHYLRGAVEITGFLMMLSAALFQTTYK